MYAISTVGSLLGTFLVRAAADPARRHAAHVPRLRARARARRRGRAAAPLVARPARHRRAVRGPGRHGQGGRGRQGDPRDRDDLPVRARHRAPRRRPHARAQRGPGDPLALPAATRCSPAATGTASSSMPFATRAATPPRRIAILGIAGGTIARAYAHYFPAHDHRRGRDRRRAVRHRPPLLRPARRARSCASTREDARPFLRQHRPTRYDVDLPRRLPPALHPVLPLDPRVLRARPRPARARRLGDRQPRPPRGLTTSSRRC